jgi:DNA-binding transcriptional MocR family regulator
LTDRDLVSDSLGSWLSGDGALYTKLAIALRNALLRGDIPPGTALPPERTLAQTLSVSRTTVVGAYRLLREEGWLDSRQGSGHVIRHPGHDAPVPYVKSDIAEAIARNPLMRPASSPVSGMVDFSASRQASIGPLLHQVTQSCGSDLDALAGGPGYMPLGLPALRSAVARYSEELTGVPTRAEQILITAGSQQAIWLVGQLYAPYGERVIIENPTYAGSIDAFRMIGAKLEALRVTADGFAIEELDRQLRLSRPRLLLISPTCQAPTGLVMPNDQRQRLVELIDDFQVTTIEDQTLLDLLVDEGRPDALAGLSATAPILSVGSLSKIFWPGLRLGWIRGPEAIIDHLARLKGVVDLGGSPIIQRMAVGLLDKVGDVRALRHREIRRSLDHICEVVSQRLPDWSWQRPAGGLSFWAGLPTGSATEFSQVAFLHGVQVVAGPVLSCDGGNDDHVRLQFVQDDESIDVGVRRLAQAWQSYARTPHRDPSARIRPVPDWGEEPAPA